MIIPKQLQNPEIHFTLLPKWNLWGKYEKEKIVEKKTINQDEYAEYKKKEDWKPLCKIPFEYNWQNKNITFNNPHLISHLAKGDNYGIVGGGPLHLVIIDLDSQEIQDKIETLLPQTFTVVSGGKGLHHLYYFTTVNASNECKSFKVLDPTNPKRTLIDFQAEGKQVVGPGSIHESGREYKVVKDVPIATMDYAKLAGIANSFKKSIENSKKKQEKTDARKQEGSYLCKLILRGKSEQECFEAMRIFSNWSAKTDNEKMKTYESAVNFVEKRVLPGRNAEKQNPEALAKAELETWEESIYYDKDLKNYQRPQEEYLIDGFIPKGHIGVLVANTQERKTFLMLYTALCAATARPVFNIMNIPRKLKVFIIDEENGKPEIDKRIKALKEGMGITDEVLDIAYLSFFNAKLDQLNKQKRIIEFIEQFKPDMVFVDCLQRVLSIDVDKENQKLSEFFTEFVRPTVSKYGCSWIFLHHYRKRDPKAKFLNPIDEIRGASELRNYARFVIGLQRPRGQEDPNIDKIILKIIKMSNAPQVPDRLITFTTQGTGIVVKYEGEASEVLNVEKLCAIQIKEWILEEGLLEFKTKDVEEAKPGGYGESTIHGALKRLVSDEFIVKVKRGVYKLSSGAEQKVLE